MGNEVIDLAAAEDERAVAVVAQVLVTAVTAAGLAESSVSGWASTRSGRWACRGKFGDRPAIGVRAIAVCRARTHRKAAEAGNCRTQASATFPRLARKPRRDWCVWVHSITVLEMCSIVYLSCGCASGRCRLRSDTVKAQFGALKGLLGNTRSHGGCSRQGATPGCLEARRHHPRGPAIR
jgi:hypothetical protein